MHGEVSQDQSLCAASPDARLEGIRVEEIPSKADVHVEDKEISLRRQANRRRSTKVEDAGPPKLEMARCRVGGRGLSDGQRAGGILVVVNAVT